MVRKLIGLIGLVLVLLMAACQSQPPQPTATPLPSPTPVPSPTLVPTATVGKVPLVAAIDPETRATIRFLIMAQDVPAVDIYVESALGAGRLTYGRLTNPLPLMPGKYALRAVPAGSSVSSQQALFSDFITLDARESVIAVFGGSGGALTLIRYVEDLSVLAPGQARVMLINAMQSKGSADITIGDQSLGSIESGGLASDTRVFAAGRYVVTAVSEGKTLISVNQSFQERQAYTLVLLGAIGGQPSLAIVSSPTRREVRLRILNASTDAGSLDVYLGESRVAENLGYRQVTDWQTYSPRGAEVRLLPSGASSDSTPVSSSQIVLSADQADTLVIYEVKSTRDGAATFRTGITLITENLQPTVTGNLSFSVLNVARSAPQLKVMSLSQGVGDFSPIDYGKANPPIIVPEGKLTLSFNTLGADIERAIDTVEGLEVKAGFAYLYVVVDNRQGYPPLLLTTEVGQQPLLPTVTPTAMSVLNIRLINALTDVDMLDAYVDQVALFKGVKTGEGTPFTAVANIMSTVQIMRAGSTEPLARLQLLNQPNRLMTLIAFGTAEKPTFFQVLEETLPSASALLRAVHAAPGVGRLTLESPAAAAPSGGEGTPVPTAKSTQYIRAVDYGNVSGAVAVSPGTYTFVAHDVTDYHVVAQLADVKIERGKWYTLLILPGDGGAKIVVVSVDNGH